MSDADARADRSRAEACGPRHDRLMMLEARRRTFEAIRAISLQVAPGMTEEDAVALTRRVLRESGMARGWHGINIRFGVNTLNTFDVPSKPGVVLSEDDIYFIDIGPTWREWEGDGGDSFTTGDEPEMKRIAHDARAIFDAVEARWQRNGLTSEALYRCAVAESETRGWQLNIEMSGHRLSEFSLAAHYKGALAVAPFTPSPGLWMLEIQIRHPTRPFGAFFEDLLLDAAD